MYNYANYLIIRKLLLLKMKYLSLINAHPEDWTQIDQEFAEQQREKRAVEEEQEEQVRAAVAPILLLWLRLA